tara:strand:- start:163 stop:438 length:276 start_codon:yes stop_codon:yes gene_type:complete
MSEESKFNSNVVLGLAIIAVITTGWFAFGYGHDTDMQVVTTTEEPTDGTSVVASIINDEVVEIVVVTADPTNLPDEDESNSADIANAENAE